MKIAILGWGSLIWDPRSLEINKTIGQNGWFDDGPMLPIEFARISNDGRLTLVIYHQHKEVKVLYSFSKFEALDLAILDLSVREGCGKNKIGYFEKSRNKFHSEKFVPRSNIEEWIKWINKREVIDAVIWTDLSGNFKDKIGLELSPQNAVNYLKFQTLEVQKIAEQYIRRTPEIIKTPIRELIEKELEWIK